MLRSVWSRLSRYAAAMGPSRMQPSRPLVVILGSTGTGKSDLAVDIACRFDGEIINADAMQLYRGLPVTTNKISTEEQRGIPHHLLGTIGLDEETWKVGRFRREATHTIQAIRQRGHLPILVGGSQYYTDGLLFDDHLVNEQGRENSTLNVDQEAEEATAEAQHPILDGPTNTMLEKLREVDPVMADRWHPNDRRKIRRSLEIFLTTGRRASDIYAEQRDRKLKREILEQEEGEDEEGQGKEEHAGTDKEKKKPSPSQPPWECLLLWVYAKPDVLNARLNARVDTMLDRGLLEEASQMYDVVQTRLAQGESIDRSLGIWQSIGFKEVERYIAALRSAAAAQAEAEGEGEGDGKMTEQLPLEEIKQACLDEMKAATRRYAKYQMRWIRHKTIPMLAEARALDHLYLLDSTDRDRWSTDVMETAVRLVGDFMEHGHSHLPAPEDISDTARDVLAANIATNQEKEAENSVAAAACRRTCDVCRVTLVTADQWGKHINGHRHRRAVQKQRRRALMVIPPEARARLEQEKATKLDRAEFNPAL